MPVGQKLWWYSKQVKFWPPSGLGVCFLGEQEEWRLVSKSQTRRVCQKHSLKVWKGGKLKRRKGKTSKNHHLKKQQTAEFLWINARKATGDTFKRDPFGSPGFTTHPHLHLSSSSKWSSLAPSSTSGEPGMAATSVAWSRKKSKKQPEKNED